MIFTPLIEDIDEDGNVHVWSFTKLLDQAQLYAANYGVDYSAPLLKWVVSECFSVNLLLLDGSLKFSSARQWDEMFQRWRDAKLMSFHAWRIAGEETEALAPEELSSYAHMEELIWSVCRPDARSHRVSAAHRRSRNMYNN